MVFKDQRLASLPGVPTATEMGFSGSYTTNYYPIWTRRDTDPEAVSGMAKLVKQTIDSKIQDLPGLIVLNYSTRQATTYVNREIQIFESIAAKNKK